MFDSDELSSNGAPNDNKIEQCLRRLVRDALKNNEEITVNQARTLAESELGLDTGFLKTSSNWKTRSKDIINAAVQEPDSPEKSKKPVAKAGTKRKAGDVEPAKRARKRANKPMKEVSESDLDGEEEEVVKPKSRKQTASKPPNRAPKTINDSDEDVSELDVPEDDEKDNRVKPKRLAVANSSAKRKSEDAKPAKTVNKKMKAEFDAEMSGPDADDNEGLEREEMTYDKNGISDTKADNSTTVSTDVKPRPIDDNDSDLSSVIDEPPKKQRKKKAPTEKKSNSKSDTASKPRPKSTAKDISPDEEEIKRLQGWLVKCGIRKLWHKELANCETPKAKIKHLKGMLEGVGMTGRYSVEKARSIKEARELAAELEAAKEFNEQWGQDEDEEDEKNDGATKQSGRTRRALPKGLVDFGDSGEDSG